MQWCFSQDRLIPSSFAALLDAAPLLALSPLFCCYCFALVAALQELRSSVVHSAKALKAMCSVFTYLSSYTQLAERGPWSYDWASELPQLRRELSTSILVAWCLDSPEHIPKEAHIRQAVEQAERSFRQHSMQAAQQQRTMQSRLQDAHRQLDTALSIQHVVELATVLSEVTALQQRTTAATNTEARLEASSSEKA